MACNANCCGGAVWLGWVDWEWEHTEEKSPKADPEPEPGLEPEGPIVIMASFDHETQDEHESRLE